ncbi:hypothetical protein [Flavobacterium sp. Root420]|uniref:hypothetical protein n=1 Tax=Flavobacterium sp. Root420 TaxID=1736533 RepID=UPI0006F7A501|nr:hypothetical protein [Flavobacterium sp. Root420]KQX00767.1 hypothetical protein ASC72_07850 [Flavobacterium sp. Root420]
MAESHSYFLNNLLDNRKKVIELIIISLVLGIGVSFISSSLFDYIKIENKNNTYLLLGSIMTIGSMIYLASNLFGRRKFEKKIEGFFIVDRENKNIIKIDNYHYSNNILEYLDSARAEDARIDDNWLKTDFGNIHSERQTLLPIIESISEYYFLNNLSMHLSAFFNNTSFSDDRLRTYERKDITYILLTNYFLELFSKPVDQRSKFQDNDQLRNVTYFKRGETEGKVTSSYHNGAMFQHFNLVLPNESKVSREKNSTIIIQNDRFKITVETIVSGVNTYIPIEFKELYLNLKPDHNPAFITTYRINVEFSKFSFLKSSSWEYYKWLDSYLEDFERKVSEKYYFDNQIQWDKTYPILKVLSFKLKS